MKKICHYSIVATLFFACPLVFASSNFVKDEVAQKVKACVYKNKHVPRDECYNTLSQFIKNNKLFDAKEYYFKQIEIYDEMLKKTISANEIEQNKALQFNKLYFQHLFYLHTEDILMGNTDKYDKEETFIDICLGIAHYHAGQPEGKGYFDKAQLHYNHLMKQYTEKLTNWKKWGFDVLSPDLYGFDQNKKERLEKKFSHIFAPTTEQISTEHSLKNSKNYKESLKVPPQSLRNMIPLFVPKQNPAVFLENLKRPQASITKSPKRKKVTQPTYIKQKLIPAQKQILQKN